MWLILLMPCTGTLNVAVTELVVVNVMVQVAVPVQPDQPPNVSIVAGVSVNVICVFCGNDAEQVVGQLIPAGLLVTVPAPVPVAAMVNPKPGLNVALTVAASVRVTLHVLVPEQLPPHPAKK
jgi:hypothetical protein